MCISDLLWWHSHPPLFFSFYAVEISFPACCLQRRRHLCVMIYITFVLCALYHQACSLTFTALWQFSRFSLRTCKEKERKKNTFWQSATATVFYDPLHVIIAREMGRGEKTGLNHMSLFPLGAMSTFPAVLWPERTFCFDQPPSPAHLEAFSGDASDFTSPVRWHLAGGLTSARALAGAN